jgi:Flp pilus assembly protein TadB
MPLALSIGVALLGLCLYLQSVYGGRGQSEAILRTLLHVEDSSRNELATSDARQHEIRDRRQQLRWSVTGAALAALVCGVVLHASWANTLCAVLVGALAGEAFRRGSRERAEKRRIKSMEFYLPTVMERIVMGVGTGLDIVPALREASAGAHDPVSELMRRIVDLSEGGVPVEAALEASGKQCPNVSVKHALVHIRLAYRQGGEVVRPLRELSDATQMAYQEAVEEQIARLPVKAVLPLVLTFTGLIVCFLTVPLMQVSQLARTVTNDAR